MSDEIKEENSEMVVVIFSHGEAVFGYKLERAMEMLKSGIAKRVMLVKKSWYRVNPDCEIR